MTPKAMARMRKLMDELEHKAAQKAHAPNW